VSDSTAAEPFALPNAGNRQLIFAVTTPNCRTPTTDTLNLGLAARPVVDITPGGNGNVTICRGDSLQLQPNITSPTGAYVLEWSPAIAISGISTEQPLVYPTTAQDYVLAVAANGCVTRDTVRVFVAPPIVAVARVDDAVICEGDSVNLFSLTQPPVIYNWQPAASVRRPDQQISAAVPPITTTYTLTVSRDGCVKTDTVTVTVLPQPVTGFTQSLSVGCTGLQVQFTDTSFQASAWQWNFGDGNSSNEPNPTHTYLTPGTFEVQLITLGLGGCADTLTSTQQVSIAERRTAAFSTVPALPDTLYLPNADLQLAADDPFTARYLWTMGDGQTYTTPQVRHRYQRAGSYDLRLVVQDAGNCIADTTLRGIVVLEPVLDIPNLFTPNGDSFNDFWQLRYEGSETVKVAVLDRWGRQVFSSNSPQARWDGTLNGGADAQVGVYLYHIEIGNKTYTGTVTLVR
jgi:gliding motility-associated-like protein